MGKLPTASTRPSKLHIANPDKSFQTNIEGSIPARSPRRPQSIIGPSGSDDISRSSIIMGQSLTATTGSSPLGRGNDKANSKRMSTQLNDDLDKLMNDASSMSSYNPERFVPPPPASDLEVTEVDVDSSDQNATATTMDKSTGDMSGDISGDISGAGVYTGGDAANEVIEQSIQYPTSVPGSKPSPSSSQSFDHSSLLKNAKSRHSTGPDISNEGSSLPPRPSEDKLRRARQISANLQKRHLQEKDISLGTLPNVSKLQNEHGDIIATEADLNDENYIDIEEPITHPSRGKSVKNSIRRPQKESHHNHHHHRHHQQHNSGSNNKKDSTMLRKKSKRKSKQGTGASGTSGSGSGSELKPFSYNTLISLLESMNGTIIGEEFSSLNIPIREKQLIEKIIDSLSRLSSDMILDQERYDTGLKRMEQALRVLEGFN